MDVVVCAFKGRKPTFPRHTEICSHTQSANGVRCYWFFTDVLLNGFFIAIFSFVSDEGKGDTSCPSPEDSSTQLWRNKASSKENLVEYKDAAEKDISSPTKELGEDKLESTITQGISLRNKLIPFAPVLDSPPYSPAGPDNPFEPPSDSPDDVSGGSRCSTGEGRSISPDSAVSAAPPASPSPPLTPNSAATKTFDFKLGALPSQSRRQWGVTDKASVLP